MNQKQITKLKTEYYNEKNINRLLEEIFFKNSYREVAILNKGKNGKKFAFRGMTFSNIEYFKKCFFGGKFNNHFEDDTNFYCSVARIKALPPFSFKNRAIETKPFFEKRFINYIYAYDLFLDFDYNGETHISEFLNEVNKIIDLILAYGLKSELVFSGNRGFKILIYNNAHIPFKLIKMLIPKIKEKFSLKSLDEAGYFFPSKLMKMNNTIVFSNGNCKIAYPLKSYNYKHFFQEIEIANSFEIFDYNGNDYSERRESNSDFLEKGFSITGFKNFVGSVLE